MKFTRRYLLGSGAAGLAAGAIGSFVPAHAQAGSAHASSEGADTSVDAVVIGAGISGLIAARDLEGKGFTTTVLEARSRIGGRCVRKQTIQNWWVDLGGQWMGRSHHLFQGLVKELEIKTFDSYFDGNTVLVWNGKKVVVPMLGDWTGTFLDVEYKDVPVNPADQKSALKLHREFLELVKTIDAEKPWTSPNAKLLDAQTIDSWMRSRTDSELAHYIMKWYTRVGGSGGFEPSDASILHLAQTQKASPQGEAPETWLLYGAAGQMPELIARQLKGSLRTSAAVQAVLRQSDGSYLVKAADGTSHRARSVVVAMPPALRSRIHFEPGLPPMVSGLHQRSPMGSMFKVLAVYPKAWWRQKGLNGYGQGNLPTVELTADSSPPSASPGVLAAFVAADRAITLGLQSPQQRRKAILADLVEFWGPEAGNPVDYIEINWAEENWTTGAFTSYLTPGAWTSFGPAWREPVGCIVWAGTESSPRWAGFYEGAIQAGLDAAKTVQKLLR